jgi:hypothetical protein
MSHAVLAAIIIPIVALLALAGWLVAVYRADKNPQGGRTGRGPRRHVAGGQFRSRGGRQLMPRRDETPPEAFENPDGTPDTGPGGRQATPHE